MKVRLDRDWDGNRVKLVHELTNNGLPLAKAFEICNDLAEKWLEDPEHEVEKNVRIRKK